MELAQTIPEAGCVNLYQQSTYVHLTYVAIFTFHLSVIKKKYVNDLAFIPLQK